MERREFLKTAGVGTLAFGAIGFEVGCSVPSWVTTAIGIASIAVNIAGELVSAIDPAIAPLVTAVLAGFNAILKALQDYQAALAANGPTTTLLQAIEIAFATLKADVASLLAALPGSGSSVDAVITAVIALIAEAVSDIGALLPVSMTAQVKVYRGFPAANSWKGKDFKSRFNNDVNGDSRFHAL